MIAEVKDALIRGREVRDQINILGDDGVPMEYHIQFWKAEVVDFVILQQDAFDEVDAMTPMERQKFMMELVLKINRMTFDFTNFNLVATYFKRLINQLRQVNYTEFKGETFTRLLDDYEAIVNENRVR
jgi:V/A-type H+-transporting ATPase subunit A